MFKELDIILNTIKAGKEDIVQEGDIVRALEAEKCRYEAKHVAYLIKEAYIFRDQGKAANYNKPGHTVFFYTLETKGELILAEGGFTGKNKEQQEMYKFTKGSYKYARWAFIAAIAAIALTLLLELFKMNKGA